MKIDRALDEFRVPFTGLKDGHHVFEFHLGETFFDAFEYSEIDSADISATVLLEKTANMLVFITSLKGIVQVDCDRCGEPIDQAMEGSFRLVVKFGSETGETDEDVLVLGPSEFMVDLSQYLYEYAHLTVPARRVHPLVEECNQDILKKLEEMRVTQDAESKWIEIKDMALDEPGLPDDDEEE